MPWSFLLKNWDFVLIAALLVVLKGYSFLADYRLKERDEARAARVVAERSLEAQTESSLAAAAVFEKTMEETDERNRFETDALVAIAADRETGDGALAPVLLDAAKRLRLRQAKRAALHGGGAAKPAAMPAAKAVP